MVARWRWILSRVTRRLWFRATLFSLAGVLTALIAAVLRDYIPESLSATVGADAVDKILGIIASSMLAVTTFSLSTMVSAYSAASSGVTPRATTLVMEDATTQNALATFIGSFLFSLVGIIALSTGIYGSQGRVLLFGVTLVVVIIIVYTLLRWIDHLSKLGRVGETIDRVEQATIDAINARNAWPNMGACSYPDNAPEGMHAVASVAIGYVQHIDIGGLSTIACQAGIDIYVQVAPGRFVVEGEALALVNTRAGACAAEEVCERIRNTFTVGVRRTFEHDPRFGLSVLSEIASRALSPAVNDPGTAIDVLGRGVRTLALWGRPASERAANGPVCPQVFARELEVKDLFNDFFSPISRDGAALVEVGIRTLKALASLVRMNPHLAEVAAAQATLVLKHGECALRLVEEKRHLQALAVELGLTVEAVA